MRDVYTAGQQRDTAPYDEVGRVPEADEEFDHGDVPVVGICERCGHEIHDGVIGHGCVDGHREHREGEDIRPVREVVA